MKGVKFCRLTLASVPAAARLLGVVMSVMLSVSLASSTASAAADPQGWVGGLFGISIPNENNTSARPIYGITGGAKVGSELGIGGYFLTSQKNEDVSGVSTKFDYDLYGVELGYHFEGEAKGVYLAGRLGTSKVKQGAGALQVSASPMHFGAVAGVNKFFGDYFSLGGEASFMSVQSSGGLNAFSMLNFAATAKIWF